MGKEQQKVLEMVAEGKISPEEGVRLIEALAEDTGGRTGFHHGFEMPDIRIPKIDLGKLGDICVELRNTVTESARKAHGHIRRSRAGRYFELKDYPMSVAHSKGVERCKLNLAARAGRLGLKGGDADGKLLSGKVKRVPEEPVVLTEVREKQIELTFKHSLGRCDLTASTELEYRIGLDNAAADTKLDLEQLKVEELAIDNNAGNVSINLGGRVAHVEVDLKNNAGNIKLRVPGSHAIRVVPTGSLSSTNLEKHGLEVVDGAATSGDWEENNKRVDVVLSQNVAHFQLDWQRSDGVKVGEGDSEE